MNLFILSSNPKEAAKKHCDKHVIKMILEACQMLYTTHWIFEYSHLLDCKSAIAISKAQKQLIIPASMETAPFRKDSIERGFRPVHIHHPCTQWIRASRENYIFACELAIALGEEYVFRWPGRGDHSCMAHARWLRENIPESLDSKGLTRFVMAMDNQYKISSDPVISYRYYYKTSKKERGLLKYTKRDIPAFIFHTKQYLLQKENENCGNCTLLD